MAFADVPVDSMKPCFVHLRKNLVTRVVMDK